MGHEPFEAHRWGAVFAEAERLARSMDKSVAEVLEEALAGYAPKPRPRPLGEGFKKAVAMAHAQLDQISAADRGRGSDTSDLYDDQGMPL